MYLSFFSFVNLQYGLSHHLNDGRQNLLGAIMIAGHYVIPEVIKALSLSTVVNCLHVKFFYVAIMLLSCLSCDTSLLIVINIHPYLHEFTSNTKEVFRLLVRSHCSFMASFIEEIVC